MDQILFLLMEFHMCNKFHVNPPNTTGTITFTASHKTMIKLPWNTLLVSTSKTPIHLETYCYQQTKRKLQRMGRKTTGVTYD